MHPVSISLSFYIQNASIKAKINHGISHLGTNMKLCGFEFTRRRRRKIFQKVHREKSMTQGIEWEKKSSITFQGISTCFIKIHDLKDRSGRHTGHSFSVASIEIIRRYMQCWNNWMCLWIIIVPFHWNQVLFGFNAEKLDRNITSRHFNFSNKTLPY